MQPDERTIRFARRWLEKAERDLLLAERAMAEPPLLDLAVFHCQQAVEKALKGFLAWNASPFRRTHDLVDLFGRCVALDPALESLRTTASELTPFASAFRYPSEPSEPTAEDAQRAITHAREAFELIRSRMT